MVKRILEKLFHLEPEFCPSCDILRQLLEQERQDKHRVMDRLLAQKEEVQIPVTIEKESLKSPNLPWAARRAQLENEDRIRAENSRAEIKAKRSIDDLEKEVKLNEEQAS